LNPMNWGAFVTDHLKVVFVIINIQRSNNRR
jgi:hypothetical protein